MRTHYAVSIATAALLLIGAGCGAAKQATSVFEGTDSGPLTLVMTLSEQNGSGEIGSANLIPVSATETKVEITLAGEPSGGDQPAHIHTGSCPNPSAVKYPLNNIVNGKSETIIAVSTNQLVKELPLAINVHKSAKESGVYVACGNVPSGQ